MKTRRDFLQSLMVAAAMLAADPERLLWTPGAKKLFIPPPKMWRDVEIFIDGAYRPVDFSSLRPGQLFHFVDDPDVLIRCLSEAMPCEPPGNYIVHTTNELLRRPSR